MRDEQRLSVRNSAHRIGPGSWDWAVWIEGPAAKLDGIDQVEYVLHPTFPQPVRIIRERSTKFRLECRGWGEFMIHVKIQTKDGHSHEFDHWLRLQDTVVRGSSPISPETIASDLNKDFPEPLTVFVSYSRADSPVFQTLRRTLEPRGLKVVTADAVRAGQPWEREIKSLIGSAHAVVALLSDEPSRWVLEEIAEAEKQHVTVIPVLLGNADLPTNLASLQPLRIQNPNDQDQTISFVKEELAKLGL